MAYNALPSDLPSRLRSYGLKVEEVDGWRGRGRPASTGSFDPVGVLCHHTATSKASRDVDVIRLLVNGRSDLPGPLCQIGLGRDGTVYLIASGRANHAGRAKSSGTVAAGDGNALYVGIEAFNDGRGEAWPKTQYDAYVTLAAALCREVTGNSVNTVRGHKESSVTGKIDPTFDMGEFRNRVEAEIRDRANAPTRAERAAAARAAAGKRVANDLTPAIRKARTGRHRFPRIADRLAAIRRQLRGREPKEGA